MNELWINTMKIFLSHNWLEIHAQTRINESWGQSCFTHFKFVYVSQKKALNKINEYFLHTIEVCHFIEARCIACVKTIKLDHGHGRSYCCCQKLQCFPIFNIFIFRPLLMKVISKYITLYLTKSMPHNEADVAWSVNFHQKILRGGI